MSLFFNFPDSLLKLTSETTRLKGRAFDLQETAFAERRKLFLKIEREGPEGSWRQSLMR